MFKTGDMAYNMDDEDRRNMIADIQANFDSKLDGRGRNLLLSECPFCGHGGYKFGIFVAPDPKRFGSSHCFCCGKSFKTLADTLVGIGLADLVPQETTELNGSLDSVTEIEFDDEDEIDDSLVEVEMPDGYKRTMRNDYLKYRGYEPDDFHYFPAGTTRGMNYLFKNYVLFEIIDHGKIVGYVGRHTWDKEDIDEWNDTHRRQIRRYRNSEENGFAKLLYNYDSVIKGKTRCVILCEGVFDVIALTRKMELYDNADIVPVATFGKKISDVQMYKLQQKGVTQVVVGYDNDAREAISKVAGELETYFDTYIAAIPDGIGKDWDEMDAEEIYEVFANHLMTVREFNLG